jgi:hypothetical protein
MPNIRSKGHGYKRKPNTGSTRSKREPQHPTGASMAAATGKEHREDAN